MADPAIVVASIAAVPAVVGGTLGGYAALKQRGNDNLNMVIQAMQSHMSTLSGENANMRDRVQVAEGKANDALVKLAECETERKDMQKELADLSTRMNNAESRDV